MKGLINCIRDERLPVISGVENLKIEKNGAATEMTDGLQFILGRLRISGHHQLHQAEQLVHCLSAQSYMTSVRLQSLQQEPWHAMLPGAGSIMEQPATAYTVRAARYTFIYQSANMNAALCDFSICGALEKHLLTYLLTYIHTYIS